MGKLFGTDGIRGIANVDLTSELALKTARAAASVLIRHLNKKPLVIIGTDTRISAAMLTDAMSAGFCSAGADVLKIGIVPTPAIPFLLKHYNADIGVMISASHNPAKYNGIKLFDSNGYKLPDLLEDEIETAIYDGVNLSPEEIGTVKEDLFAADIYADYILKDLENFKLNNVNRKKIIIDCANGAASTTVKRIFNKFNTDIEIINDNPNGYNINRKCGSTHMDELSKIVIGLKASLGIAFDGDADRCLICDELGRVLDGDRLIAAMAIDLKSEGKLRKNKIAVTTMSNMGFLKLMNENGIECELTRVGDRYVLEEMLKDELSIGGEQSGHIILLDKNTTGDGQMTAVSFLKLWLKSNNLASFYYDFVKFYPQISVNIKADSEMKDHLLSDESFNKALNTKREIIKERGRIIVRASGTEPIVRIMVEGQDEAEVKAIAGELCILAESIITTSEN